MGEKSSRFIWCVLYPNRIGSILNLTFILIKESIQIEAIKKRDFDRI